MVETKHRKEVLMRHSHAARTDHSIAADGETGHDDLKLSGHSSTQP